MNKKNAPTARARVLISGRVQGVSFRWNTQYMAQRLGLTGWVRNLWDGRVEAIFEGPEDAVKEAVAWCHYGQRPAKVNKVDVTYQKPDEDFANFRIKW